MMQTSRLLMEQMESVQSDQNSCVCVCVSVGWGGNVAMPYTTMFIFSTNPACHSSATDIAKNTSFACERRGGAQVSMKPIHSTVHLFSFKVTWWYCCYSVCSSPLSFYLSKANFSFKHVVVGVVAVDVAVFGLVLLLVCTNIARCYANRRMYLCDMNVCD